FNPSFLERMGYDAISDLTKLYPDTEREKWEKIGLPSGDIGNAADLKNDGKRPATPTSAKHSSHTLSWNKSSSKDVVGYYIVRTDKVGGDFTTIGSTTKTSYDIDRDGVYRIIAADYFGLKSPSTEDIIVGDVDDEKDDEDKNESDDEDDDDSENDGKDDNQNDNNRDNNGNNENRDDKHNDDNNSNNDKPGDNTFT